MAYTLLTILICFVCLLLMLVVMVQNPKGGGLSSTFGGAGTTMISGVQKTNEFLDKTTWTLSTIIVVLILLTTMVSGNGNVQRGEEDIFGDTPRLEQPVVPTVPSTDSTSSSNASQPAEIPVVPAE